MRDRRVVPVPTDSRRPDLTPALPADEFVRWYWLKDELAAFARVLGISATGAKAVLSERIGAALAGEDYAEPVAGAGARRRTGPQLSGPLTAHTVIPAGQRCSQVVRAWFVEQIGTGFAFDAPMREFFAATDGHQTLADALAHWRATRDRPQREIDAQFEYNRFTRAWHREHPTGTRAELLSDWQAYRGLPSDERGRA